MYHNLRPTIIKLGKMGELTSNFIAPDPPAGSAVDQDTTTVNADAAMVVAGSINGDASIRHYLSQLLSNDRTPVTGFGAVIGYTGSVTNDIEIALCSTQLDPDNPGGQTCEVGFSVSPGDLDPDSWYYVTATFEGTPVDFGANTPIYLLMATIQDYDETTSTGWVWAGATTNPYNKGAIEVFNNSTNGWGDFLGGGYDGLFYTYTEGTAPACSTYTTEADCTAHGCYWYDNACHEMGPDVCSDYTNQTDCQNAGCYWWSDGTCNSTPEGGGNCADFTTQSTCEANNCFWYQKYFWEEPSCHDKEQDMMMDYLPFMLAGGGALLLIIALASSGSSQPQYVPMPMPQYQ